MVWGQIDFSEKWERDYELTLAVYADYVVEVENITENDCVGFNKSLSKGDVVKSSLIPGGVGAEESKGGKRKSYRNRHGGGGHGGGYGGNQGGYGGGGNEWNQGFGGQQQQYGNEWNQQPPGGYGGYEQGGYNQGGYDQGGYGGGGYGGQGYGGQGGYNQGGYGQGGFGNNGW